MSEINTKTEVLKLKDISINYDGKRIPIKESERKKGQYPYYGASGIIDYIDDYLFDGEYLLIAEDGENLKSRKTPIAFIAKGKFWVNNHAHIITGNHKVLTKYLNYYFQILDISPYLTGAVMPKLTQTNLNNIEVSVPSLDKQKKIVNYLSSIDDKIELNRQINKTLEAMAQAIFKSWFIDFDPVKAKIKALKTGKDPLRAAMEAISGKTDAQLDLLPRDQYDKLAHTASLFPDKLVPSPLGDIPDGWEVTRLNQLLEINPLEKLAKGAVAPYIDMASLSVSDSTTQPFILRPFGSGTKFRNRDTLLARITPCLENGKTAFVQSLPEDAIGWGSTEFIVLRTKQGIPDEFAYLLARNEIFRAYAIQNMTGTSGRQRVQSEVIGNYMFNNPSLAVWQEFGKQVEPLFCHINNNMSESYILKNLRHEVLGELFR